MPGFKLHPVVEADSLFARILETFRADDDELDYYDVDDEPEHVVLHAGPSQRPQLSSVDEDEWTSEVEDEGEEDDDNQGPQHHHNAAKNATVGAVGADMDIAGLQFHDTVPAHLQGRRPTSSIYSTATARQTLTQGMQAYVPVDSPVHGLTQELLSKTFNVDESERRREEQQQQQQHQGKGKGKGKEKEKDHHSSPKGKGKGKGKARAEPNATMPSSSARHLPPPSSSPETQSLNRSSMSPSQSPPPLPSKSIRRRVFHPLDAPLDLPTDYYAAIVDTPDFTHIIDYPARIHHLRYPSSSSAPAAASRASTPALSSRRSCSSWEDTHLIQRVSCSRIHARWARAITELDREQMASFFRFTNTRAAGQPYHPHTFASSSSVGSPSPLPSSLPSSPSPPPPVPPLPLNFEPPSPSPPNPSKQAQPHKSTTDKNQTTTHQAPQTHQQILGFRPHADTLFLDAAYLAAYTAARATARSALRFPPDLLPCVHPRDRSKITVVAVASAAFLAFFQPPPPSGDGRDGETGKGENVPGLSNPGTSSHGDPFYGSSSLPSQNDSSRPSHHSRPQGTQGTQNKDSDAAAAATAADDDDEENPTPALREAAQKASSGVAQLCTDLARTFPNLRTLLITSIAVIDRPLHAGDAYWALESEFGYLSRVVFGGSSGVWGCAGGKRTNVSLPTSPSPSTTVHGQEQQHTPISHPLLRTVSQAFARARRELRESKRRADRIRDRSEMPAGGGSAPSSSQKAERRYTRSFHPLAVEEEHNDMRSRGGSDDGQQAPECKTEARVLLYYRDAFDRAVERGWHPGEIIHEGSLCLDPRDQPLPDAVLRQPEASRMK